MLTAHVTAGTNNGSKRDSSDGILDIIDMVVKEVWEVMALVAGVAVMEVGVISMGVRDEGTHVHFLIGGGEFL